MFTGVTFGLSRMVGQLSRTVGLGAGSSIPGRVATILHPGALRVLSGDRTIALVSGTNGKTTVTALLVAALRDPMSGPGAAVATNHTGSNLQAGLVTALLAGGCSAAVLEVDEVVLGHAIASTAPAVVVLLNLSRDQLDRTSEVQTHVDRWGDALRRTTARIVANADDPLVVRAVSRGRPGSEAVEWVGAGQPWRADAVTCPSCHRLWDMTGRDWWCRHCGLRRPHPLWQLVGDDQLVIPDETVMSLDTTLPGRANAANAAMAVAAACGLGVEPGVAIERMRHVSSVAGRYGVHVAAGVQVRLLLAKNPAGWGETLDLIGANTDAVVLAVNARPADGLDPSWLWDVPFEVLTGRQVVITGDRVLDLATRLRYAEVDHTSVPTLRGAIEQVAGSRADVVANYTAFAEAARLLGAGRRRAGGGPGRPFAATKHAVTQPAAPGLLP